MPKLFFVVGVFLAAPVWGANDGVERNPHTDCPTRVSLMRYAETLTGETATGFQQLFDAWVNNRTLEVSGGGRRARGRVTLFDVANGGVIVQAHFSNGSLIIRSLDDFLKEMPFSVISLAQELDEIDKSLLTTEVKNAYATLRHSLTRRRKITVYTVAGLMGFGRRELTGVVTNIFAISPGRADSDCWFDLREKDGFVSRHQLVDGGFGTNRWRGRPIVKLDDEDPRSKPEAADPLRW